MRVLASMLQNKQPTLTQAFLTDNYLINQIHKSEYFVI
jgi:hypothetical protein